MDIAYLLIESTGFSLTSACFVLKLCLAFSTVAVVYRITQQMTKKQQLKIKQERKRLQVNANINSIRSILTDDRSTDGKDLLALTDRSLDEIQAELYNGQISPLDLLHAYQLKVLKLHETGNSGICEFIKEAEDWARSLKLPHNPEQRQTLYGIPVSIKELCKVKGYDSTFGIIKLCEKPSEETSVVVQVLQQQGAIPFVLTTSSQAALTVCGFNPVFGDLTNPFSKHHEPGGSSTGEAVLLSQYGSPIGIGTDLGGSIRIPSAFCGLAGLKPTAKRISNKGGALSGEVQSIGTPVSIGPMGHRVDDLAKAMRTLLTETMFKLDPTVPPLPFNESIYAGEGLPKLKIGYYLTLDHPSLVQSVPSVQRALKETLSYLENCGHTIIPYKLPRLTDCKNLAVQAFLADIRFNVPHLLEGEPLNEHTQLAGLASKFPPFIKQFVDKIFTSLYGEPTAMVRQSHGPVGTRATLKLINDIHVYLDEFAKSWVDAGGLDVLICPVWPFPAIATTIKSVHTAPALVYTAIYNMLDYPAGSVPVGFVTDEDIENTEKMHEIAIKNRDKFAQAICKEQLTTRGLPLAVQVVGKPWAEELVLRVMREIENGVKK